MNKKFFSILLAVVLTASYAQAQITFGARAGLNLTNVWGDDTDDIKFKPGFQIGVVADYALSNELSIQPGLLFAQQGFQFKEDNDYDKYTLNYLQIPINAQYKLDLGGMKAFVQAGPYLGFGIGGKNKWKYDGEKDDDKIKFGNGNDDNFSPLDFGLGLGVGLQFSNIQVGVGYNLGLANITHKDYKDNFKVRNMGLALTVTCFFGN